MPIFSAIAGAVGGGIFGGIVAGAAAGAVVGGVTSALTGGDIGKGILKGALLGGVAGGIGSYVAGATWTGGSPLGPNSAWGMPASSVGPVANGAVYADALGQGIPEAAASTGFAPGGALKVGSSFLSNPMVQYGLVNSATGLAKGIGEASSAKDLAAARAKENERIASIDPGQTLQVTNPEQQANSYRQYFTPEPIGAIKTLA